MNVIPLGERVLLKAEREEEKTKSGLYIPETAQEKTQIGEVVAIGDTTDKIAINVGQRVMYDKYAGTTIKVDGVDHLIVKNEDIIAIVK